VLETQTLVAVVEVLVVLVKGNAVALVLEIGPIVLDVGDMLVAVIEEVESVEGVAIVDAVEAVEAAEAVEIVEGDEVGELAVC
jgi:hypothetical protein